MGEEREGQGMGGQERDIPLPVECWDADLWAVLMEGGVSLRVPIKRDVHYPLRPRENRWTTQEQRNKVEVGRGSGRDGVFLKKPKNEEKVFPF